MTNEEIADLENNIVSKKIIPGHFIHYAKELKKIRTETHKNHITSNQTNISEETGLVGEMQFSYITGLKADFSIQPNGDYYDFFHPNLGLIDIKTTPYESLADSIYVETKYIDPEKVYVRGLYNKYKNKIDLLGWEYGKNIIAKGIRDYHFTKRTDVETYKLPIKDARPMSELYEKIGVKVVMETPQLTI